jgi:hypothetical protein
MSMNVFSFVNLSSKEWDDSSLLQSDEVKARLDHFAIIESSVSNGFSRSFSPSLHDSLLTSSKAHAGVYLYYHLIIARLIVACSCLIASNNY